jgi:hypothetical protein
MAATIPYVVVVDSKVKPWVFTGGLNTSFPFGDGSGTAPIVVFSNLVAGNYIGVTTVGGLVDCGTGLGPFDANGAPSFITGDTIDHGVYYPSHYFVNGKTLGLGGLCGAFTDSTGQVIQAVQIGTTQSGLLVPVGATQFQVGIDDNIFGDNTGSFSLNITAENPFCRCPAVRTVSYDQPNVATSGTGTNTRGYGQVYPTGYGGEPS